MENRLFIAEQEPVDELLGVFNDSLPDGWGRLVTDRFLLKHGLNPSDITPLTRLTMLSQDRIGGLRFEPFKLYCISETIPNLNLLYNEAREIMLNNDSQMSIEEFFIQGRSSNGARPKIGVKDSEGSWIVKLPSVYDTKDMGTMEYDYNQAAEECFIEVHEFKLFTSSQCKGFLLQKDSTDQAQDKFIWSPHQDCWRHPTERQQWIICICSN